MAYFHSRSLFVNIQIIIVFFSFLVSCFAELPRFDQAHKGDGSLSFLVIGDWGRKGMCNQSEVAFQMGRIGDELDVDFVISTGDNFYDDGLTGVDDPAFEQSFKSVYTAKSLQKPWYSVLGNHDYRGDAESQVNPVLRNIDSRWLCLRSFILNAEIAEFFFVDTTPFVDMYLYDPKHTYDWRGIIPRDSYLAHLLKDLASALSESTAKWKIVIGHHAIRSTGCHADTPELVDQLLPIMKANNVDLYMNGHDHCLEHVSCDDSPIQFMTSGGGSKAWMCEYKEHQICDVKFFHIGQGFLSVQLTNTDAIVAFHDVFGKVQHQWNSTKLLHSAI